MKILAVHNAEGRILAAVAVDTGYRGPVPVASDGDRVGVFDIPASHVRASPSELRLDEIAANFRVDASAQRLVDAKTAY